jgi:hypothetical protein
MFGILIYGKGTDPGTFLHFQLIMITHYIFLYQVFHSFYEEIQSEFPISIKTKNLFLSLAESITQTLHVTSCYVCGGTNMGDHWPWEAKELNPQKPFNKTTLPSHRESVCFLKTSIIGNYCISCPKGQFSTLLGDLICLGLTPLARWSFRTIWKPLQKTAAHVMVLWKYKPLDQGDAL